MKFLISSLIVCISFFHLLQASEPVFISVHVKQRTLIVEPSTSIKNTFLTNHNFEVTYDRTIQGLPQTVLAIPYLVCISPLLWISGKTYSVPEMDYDVYYALEAIKQVFKKFHPHITWNGMLIPKKLIKNVPGDQKNNGLALLFSGGLDSVTASLGLVGRDQLLVTNQGVDMPLANKGLLCNVEDQCRSFAQAYGHANALISCNFCTILNYNYLKVFSPDITKWWWLDNCTDALNHTGITAPLLYNLGYKDLYIAASHTVDYPYPYGSHPLIDNKIRFAGIQVHHYQADLNRCQKIDLMTSMCQLYHKPIPSLRVCWTDQEGNNCLSCEKCLRTLNNIIVTGNTPLDFGFLIASEEAMHQTKLFLNSDPIKTSKIFWEWSVIQKAALKRLQKIDLSQTEREYLEWLSTIKLDGRYASNIHQDEWQKDYFTWLWKNCS